MNKARSVLQTAVLSANQLDSVAASWLHALIFPGFFKVCRVEAEYSNKTQPLYKIAF